jgi:hypothetical protein
LSRLTPSLSLKRSAYLYAPPPVAFVTKWMHHSSVLHSMKAKKRAENRYKIIHFDSFPRTDNVIITNITFNNRWNEQKNPRYWVLYERA